MKRIPIVLVYILFFLNAEGNPSFTISQNPYLTIFAYPHDILAWPSSGVYFDFRSQKLPWQGNVSDIMARPSESYTNNFQNVEFAVPYDYTGNPADIYSWARMSGQAFSRQYAFGGIMTRPYGKFMGEINFNTLSMRLSAEGVARAEEGNVYPLVPFESLTRGAEYNLGGRLIFARTLFNNPFGLKIDYRRRNMVKPDGYLNFTIDGNRYNTSHLTWGWATQSCNHIFGYSHINTDAFFQNSYSVIKGDQIDVQASYEFAGNYKSGIRFRSVSNRGDVYNWSYNSGSEFEGRYNHNPDTYEKQTERFLRAYTKARFWSFGNLDAGFLFFGQYARKRAYDVNRNSDAEPYSQEIANQFIIETNPFFNFKFDKGYIDFGLLLEGAYAPMRNIRNAWNESIRAEESGVLWNSSPYLGWTTSWENFSKGSDLFFATGGETYASVNIYKRLSMQIGLTVQKKYTLIRKVYGNSYIPDEGGKFRFDRTHIRKDRKNETWMTGNMGITYGKGPVQFIGIMQFPLAYLFKSRTHLKQTDDEVLFVNHKKNLWQVQQPAIFRTIIVCALSRPDGH